MLHRDLLFSEVAGVKLYMDILLPRKISDEKRPVIVFIQGSGYRFPRSEFQLPQLSAFARKGYAVAMITHRNSEEGHKAPAFLVDSKTAIRYLRKNADELQLDPDRIAVWGTSSGGCTALLIGMTGDDPRYQTDEHAGYSDKVCAVVDCFGPADLSEFPIRANKIGEGPNWIALYGEDPAEQQERMYLIDPIRHVGDTDSLPPFLILQGDQDALISLEQSRRMAEALDAAGSDVTLVTVNGAPHEGSFWSQSIYDEIEVFLARTV